MSLTRARSPSSKNGLPDLRLLPDAPVPDGRTVLTSPDADRRAAGRGSRKASAAFHTRYQHRREPAHADPQDDQDQRTLPQRRRRAAADLARDTARQDELANLLQLDERNGSPTHPLRRPRPRQHLTTHRYTEKRAGSERARQTLHRAAPTPGPATAAARHTARASLLRPPSQTRQPRSRNPRTRTRRPRPAALAAAAQPLRRRADHRRPTPRLLVPPRPPPIRSRLRTPRRRSPDPLQLRQNHPPPPRPRRRPPTQPRPPHNRARAPPRRPTHDRLRPTSNQRRQDRTRSDSLAQALQRPQPLPTNGAHQPRRLTNIEASPD